MKLLVIGGTQFVGRHLVEAALKRGHELALFHRGTTNPGLFAGVEEIHGDRQTDLGKLAGRSWDAVIDTCGYLRGAVRLSAEALKDAVERYVFISTISVYADFIQPGIDEGYPLAAPQEDKAEDPDTKYYGPNKVLCEQAVQEACGERALIVRPGVVMGPHDPTDRFTYWPVRVARGGEVLAPDRPDAPLQLIDARDLADFTLKLVEDRANGIYNATGPDYALTFGRMLRACRQVSKADAEFVWASKQFLRENGVRPWSDLPVWMPDEGERAGFARVDASKAIAAGLRFRPLETTIADTLAWASTLPADHEWKAGLSPDREAQLLELLRS